MKFAEKIILSTLTMTAIVFTCGSAYMISSNHEHLLSTSKERALSAHEIEAFSLESKLLQDSLTAITKNGSDETAMKNRAVHYTKQFSSYNTSQTQYALYDHHKSALYSTIDKDVLLAFPEASNAAYSLSKGNGRHVMVISSTITAGDFNYIFVSCLDFSSLYAERDRQYISFLIVTGSILLLSFGFIYLISRYLTRPITRLNEASTRIAAGHYSERTSIPTKDEIGELSRNFDHMAQANEHKILELQENVKQREEFMASFSHEIKTPMTAILGFADMLRTYDCDEDTRHQAADYIYTEGKRLENLSYTLMQLLSLREKIQLQPVKTEAVSTQLQRYYEGSGQADHLQFQMEDCVVLSQEELLFTLMRNLIDNACKASSENQTVIIRGKQEDHLYVFTIIDQGIGMSQEDLERIMQPFYMADKSRARSKGGAGLGLAIAKRICDLHHTSLRFTSQPNKGTTVTVSLEVMSHE